MKNLCLGASSLNKIKNSLPEINYTLSFEKPFTHYCEVLINIKDINQDSIIFLMPVWTPGSYLIREYSRNVEGIFASGADGKNLDLEKINKNSWRVDTKNQKEIRFSYKVYCNEFSVRTNEVNSEHAFITGAGTFMYAKGFEESKCILKINLPPEWKKVSTGLENLSGNVYSAENYDELVDTPLEIGNQNILEFEIDGIRHFICMSGKGNYKDETIINDFRKIAGEEIKLFGGKIPYKNYTFIILLSDKGGGGLEHHNSFVGIAERNIFNDEKLYKKFLGLVSHEFFHLWNVKRIRPEALGPFDYEKENYTKNLWVAEGWTSFYDDVILRRAEILNDTEYFEFFDGNINDIMRFKGRFIQSLAESSFDTWIKYYRQNENSVNSQISYYTKGALVTMMLNIEIIQNTDADRSMDDVLRIMYEDYLKDNSKGFSDSRVKEVCETVSGKNLNEFWKKYIEGTEDLPLEEYFKICGLELINENASGNASLDIESRTDNGRYIISKVFAGGTAYESGLNSGDEIIAVNETRIDGNVLPKILKDIKAGEEAEVLISRSGLIKELKVKFLNPLPKFKLKELETKTEQQKRFLEKWLTGKS